MGTLHAWELYGDGATPDIQAVAKGLGGGFVFTFLPYEIWTEMESDMPQLALFSCRSASQ